MYVQRYHVDGYESQSESCEGCVTRNLPACRRLLFPLLHVEKVPFPRATKEIGDVCTQATRNGKLFMKDALGIDNVSLNYFANLRRSKSVYHQLDYAN